MKHASALVLRRNSEVMSPEAIVADIREEAELLLMQGRFIQTTQLIQHADMTVFQHCAHVAYVSCVLCVKCGIEVDRRALIRGALLHDYFLYDWHDPKTRRPRHAICHPAYALQNAMEDYELTEKEQQIIKCHMWPLTVIPPTCTEAWVVTMADKICALLEVFRKERVRL